MRVRRRDVALAQSAYYGITGIWPLLSRRSFEAVTGPKDDWWLVETFSLTLLPIAAALAVAAARDEDVSPEAALLGAGAAGVLAGTDVAIALRRVGRPTYLLDALASGAILAGWAVSRRSPDAA